MKKIQVILLAGFLGSGKTTLTGHLLPLFASGRRIALLINDFGEFSLDNALLKKYGVPSKEIAGGSIFCVCKQANLVAQLTDIASEIDPDLLIIESSGLAEPTDAAALLQNTFLREKYALPQVITAVDTINYLKLERILPVINKQIAVADVIVLTKIDRANPEPILTQLRLINPDAAILQSDAEKIYGELKLSEIKDTPANASLRLCATATPGFSVVNWRGDSIDENKLNALLDEYKSQLLRAKGVVNGRHLELVNGEYIWTDDPPPAYNGLFFALIGNAANEFRFRLARAERDN